MFSRNAGLTRGYSGGVRTCQVDDLAPIKMFYADVTLGPGMPFTTYAEDVRVRHENEFEACLLYNPISPDPS